MDWSGKGAAMTDKHPETSSNLDEPVELVSEEDSERSGVACFTTLTKSLQDWDNHEADSKAKR